MGLFSKKKNEEVAIDELTPQIKTKLDELAQKGNQFEEEEQYEEAIQAWKEALIHFRKAPANRTVCVSVVDRVNALEVPNASLVLSARHSTFTVSAADKSLERIFMLLARGIPSSTSNDLLSKLKVFLADNGFMGSFHDDRLIDNTLF